MDTLNERLTEVMRELQISKRKHLADYCGVSEGLVAQWFTGQTKLGPKPLKAFSKTKFNLDWIADGTLPKYRRIDSDPMSNNDTTYLVAERRIQYSVDLESTKNSQQKSPDPISTTIEVMRQTDDEGRSRAAAAVLAALKEYNTERLSADTALHQLNIPEHLLKNDDFKNALKAVVTMFIKDAAANG